MWHVSDFLLFFPAVLFMEHWKRRQMRLNYVWDLTGFGEEEEVSQSHRATSSFLFLSFVKNVIVFSRTKKRKYLSISFCTSVVILKYVSTVIQKAFTFLQINWEQLILCGEILDLLMVFIGRL